MEVKNIKIHKKLRKTGPRTYCSKPIQIDIARLEVPFHRADIVIRNMDGSGISYEGKVFLNNPNANQETVLSLENGYVGSYHIFGYGALFPGDIHKERSRYDHRPSQSPLIEYKRIVVTDALRVLGQNTNAFVITIVPVLPGHESDVLEGDIIKFEKIGIITR